jgi:hypothetical protein
MHASGLVILDLTKIAVPAPVTARFTPALAVKGDPEP